MQNASANKPSTLRFLSHRQCGAVDNRKSSVNDYVKHRVNMEYSGLYGVVNDLRMAIDHTQWPEIGRCIASLVTALLDSGGMEPPFTIPAKNKQQRDMFISLGGVTQLLRLFEAPISAADARSMTENGVKRRAEAWNEVMVLLREVLYSTPLLADRVVTSRHIVFLFTMLHHQSVFENSMNLLEEILASRSETFSLAEVPALYSLVGQFSTRQMAHFCRVLALILFESEDRQIMGASKVLKSFELLNLRKDRMTRASFNIVELNQSLVIGMPNMLHHLIVILQVLNYGPTVSEYVRHNVSGHVPLSSDILTYLSGRDGRREWKHFSRLHQIASSGSCDDERVADSNVTARPGWGTMSPSGAPAPSSSPSAAPMAESTTADDDRVMRDLLNAFSADSNAGGSEGSAYDPISNILNVMQVAHSIGIAPNGVENYDGVMQMLITMSNPEADFMSRQQRSQRNSRRAPPPGADDSAYYNSFTAASARHELQFHAMVLAPHQVEVLFVMCTLLCGRRKLQVQNAFAKYGLSDVLWRMNIRMSWDAPPYEGPNPYEHIHGPSCECNPESALRVQFLRLVHNFYDRDFMNNELKSSMLSHSDVSIIEGIKLELAQRRARAVEASLHSVNGVVVLPPSTGPILLPTDTGLMGRLAATLMKEPRDSIYQFWLCSGAECFLRGQTEEVQIFFARCGLLKHLVRHVINHNTVRQTESVLQTSLDLIGEMVKYNQVNIELLQNVLCSPLDDDPSPASTTTSVKCSQQSCSPARFETPLKDESVDGGGKLDEYENYYGLENLMEESMLGDSFSSFIKVLLDNIIDSNVFLRSLYLTIEDINAINVKLFESRASKLAAATVTLPIAPLVPASPISPSKWTKSSDFATSNCLEIPANSSYLIHSWYQYSPSISTEREVNSAGRMLGLPGYQNNHIEVISGGDALSPSRSPRRMISSLGSGILGAFKGIKDTMLGQQKGDVDIIQHGISEVTLKDGSSSSRVSGTSSIDSDDDVKAARGRDIRGSSDSSDSSDSSEVSFKTALESEAATDGTSGLHVGNAAARSHTELGQPSATHINVWLLPPEIQKVSTFLLLAKTRILLRLMSIVTLRSINHENICCMNTAVLIFMFDYRRGILGETLAAVRQLAEKFGKCYCRSSNSNSTVQPVVATPEENTEGSEAAAQPTPAKEGGIHSLNSYISQSRDGCMFCKPYYRCMERRENPAEVDGTRNDHTELSPVLVNFRLLLWYWTEYYFRRGRDRLSLEFSSHIPFSCWREIVGALCADDGSPTSLVPYRLQFPESPYAPTPPAARVILKGNLFEEQRMYDNQMHTPRV